MNLKESKESYIQEKKKGGNNKIILQSQGKTQDVIKKICTNKKTKAVLGNGAPLEYKLQIGKDRVEKDLPEGSASSYSLPYTYHHQSLTGRFWLVSFSLLLRM